METIFVAIASYRDNELEKTVRDCLRKAMYPERLIFGIHWQYDNHEFFEYAFDRRFRIKKTYYKDSQGACWARHEAQKLYGGEDYVLQIDSHMRFIEGWDVICIDGIKELQKRGNKKVIISNIIPSYDPGDDTKLPHVILIHDLNDFTEDGITALKSQQVDDTPEPFSPGKCIAAGFLFSIGDLYREVLIDPELYFWGEEITYAVRAYTHGYDLYHCHRPIVYHYYMRNGNKRHWSDHDRWWEKDRISKARVRSLLMGTGEVSDLSPYGLGTERTLTDYEKYAGVDFKNRIIKRSASTHKPNNKNVIEEIEKELTTKKIGIAQIDPFSYCNASCWFCPVRYYPQPEEARVHMPFELFEKIVKDIVEERKDKGIVDPEFRFIYTSHYNEVLLYRYLTEMFQILRRYGLKTMILTNGIALTKEKVDLIKRYDDVLDGRVCLNVSAFEPERWVKNTFADTHRDFKAKLELYYKTMDNIRYASEHLTGISIQINEPDQKEADKQFALAKGLFPHVHIYKCVNLSDRAGTLHDAGVISNRVDIERQCNNKSRVIGCMNTFNNISGRHYGWLHVNAAGKAFLCCNDYSFQYVFGDFNVSTLKEIWFSKGHMEVIERSFNEICKRCSMAVWK